MSSLNAEEKEKETQHNQQGRREEEIIDIAI